MDLVWFPSQIVAKILATPGRQNLAPKYWHANIGRAATGYNQTGPEFLANRLGFLLKICVSES
jgi:hypothetical protein